MATRKRIHPWIEDEMRRVTGNKTIEKRLDGIIDRPLARFRRALTELTPDELSALETRIALKSVKSRWTRSSHGVERHRSVNELGLLARRTAETRRERETRRGALAQLRLVEFTPNVRDLSAPDREERAA